MTTIIITPPNIAWVEPTADLLREQGMKVVHLGTLAIIGFLLMSDKIAAVVVHADCVPSEWDAMRAHMLRIAPASRVLVIERDDPRPPSALASLVTAA